MSFFFDPKFKALMELKKFKFKSTCSKLLADAVTPVSLYLKLRDKYANSILLESSDYHAADNSISFLCCNPIAGFSVNKGRVRMTFPDGSLQESELNQKKEVIGLLEEFIGSFEPVPYDFNFITQGLFGYLSYEAVAYFEDIELAAGKITGYEMPEIQYTVFRNVIVINHFKSELYLFDHQWVGDTRPGNIPEVTNIIRSMNFPSYRFQRAAPEVSGLTDEEYLELIRKSKHHCHIGDVFQIVPSRRFQTSFQGDDFCVYRALRAINPSPYLFYFDYGNFRIFGSSPEAQLVIKNNKASIYPIAGTFRRTGHDDEDALLAKKLADDPKEDSEHVMLVDLARNDLSRHGSEVKVEKFKEIQYYSHVIHLVSKVSGMLTQASSTVKMVADTFPAGTLSGAPKHMAMKLIDRYEKTKRGCYGGAIGFMGFNGDFNHAIIIRSFFSQGNTLYYQAGAGIVDKSVPENELQEVYHKLEALRRAMDEAESITN